MKSTHRKVKTRYPINPLIGVIKYEQTVVSEDYKRGYIRCEGCNTNIEIGIVICPKCRTAFVGS